MRKFCVLLCTLLACACAGCGEDPNERLISETIQVLKGTTGAVEEVTNIVSAAVQQAKDSKTKLDISKIGLAITAAGELKPKARVLQNVKAQADSMSESITLEQREAYAAKHKAAFQSALESLDAAQKKLEVVLREADAEANDDGKVALKDLREKLEEGQKEFEVLTKRQS